MSDIKPTDITMFSFPGLDIAHEIYDGTDKFRHRLTCLDFPDGEWRQYEWFAFIEIGDRKFMACMDNWQPMFPPGVFEVKAGEKR